MVASKESKKDSKNPEDLADYRFDITTLSETSNVADEPGAEAERLLDDSPRINYQDLFIAFVDLLGFRQIVMRTSKHSGHADHTGFRRNTPNEIFGALSSIPEDDYRDLFCTRYLAGQNPSSVDLKLGVAGFSDTLIFWAEPKPETLGLLIHAVFRTVREFTLRGFYCRGGIKYGEVFIDDSAYKAGIRSTPIMFGPAFMQAYDLERKQANEARIILCNESIRLLNEYKNGAIPKDLRTFFDDYIFQSMDGPWQIDIFADIRKLHKDEADSVHKDEANSVRTTVQMISDQLKRVMTEYTESPTVFKKLLAVAKSFNGALMGAKTDVKSGSTFEFLKESVVPIPKPRDEQ